MYNTHPLKSYTHWKIAETISKYKPNSVIDAGGVGRLSSFIKCNITDVNIKDGVDGCNLPYEDNYFDVSISIDTLEHVKPQEKFLKELVRVAKRASVHYFLFGPQAFIVEVLKENLGHKHKCYPIVNENIFKNIGYEYSLTPFITVSEHLLMLATINNKLNTNDTFCFIDSNIKNSYYGCVLEIVK